VFERKVLRRIYGPVQDNGAWRSRYNDELYTLFKQPKLTTVIKIGTPLGRSHTTHGRKRDAQATPKCKTNRKKEVGRPITRLQEKSE
jgi:hypothetical protein